MTREPEQHDPETQGKAGGGSRSRGFDPTRSMELVWQGQKGDAGAVNELLTRYVPRMRRVIQIKVPAAQRARVDPDDVLQETLLVASRKLPELEIRTPSSILSWMARIADFQIKTRLEHLRAQKRDPARERRIASDADSVDADPGVVVPYQGPTASQFLARGELEDRIDREIQALEPSEYRDVIVMRDFLEADWETLRLEFGRADVRAAQELYQRAKRRLRERLEKYL